jgi:elongation factor 1 alpha-like protein
MSKLAALAAARKKKEGEKKELEKTKLLGAENNASQAVSTTEGRNSTLTLLERLSVNGKEQRGSEKADTFLRKEALFTSRGNRGKIVIEKHNEVLGNCPKVEETCRPGQGEERTSKSVDLRASPSTFARTIVGSATSHMHVELSHLSGRCFDVMEIYGQGLTEQFDFADYSPDDIVLKAQSSAKGLPIHRQR